MSFNDEPNWADIDLEQIRGVCVCPHCGEEFANFDEVTEEMLGNTYYCARHIPKILVFTCMNEDCTHCDFDFKFGVSVSVAAQLVEEDC